MTALIELLIVLLSSFGFGLIPFAGPSNLLIASTWALSLGYTDPVSLLALGLVVALGAAFAKGIHYMVTFFVSSHLSEKRQQRLNADAVKVKRWAFLLLFAAAATPIPDEPIVIPLGLMKYSPAKFFAAFFLGKLTITVAGAFLGSWTNYTFSEWLSPEIMVVLSVVLTIVITVIMLKVDFGKLAEKYLKRKPKAPEQETTIDSERKN
jgi:membrane protein YqaA with SNARE-associated domain